MKTKTIEEYIEVIYALQKRHGHVHTNDVASVLGVAPPSVTEMMQKLSTKRLVNYVPYHGVTLTPSGEKMARELTDKHNTLAQFLEILGVDKKDAEIDACQIEHHVSSETIGKLHSFVEFVQEAPQDQLWLDNFRHFCKTGERLKCTQGKS
jgi:DtxR family Mn-dependent transcriptional regulator